MANRRTRSRRRLTVLGAAVCVLVAAALLAGVLEAAHRAVSYRRTVDASFAAAATALLESSNATGGQLADLLARPGSLGRVLLESRLQALAQQAADDAEASESLTPPPPDAGAADSVIDTLRLRDRAVTSIRSTLEGLLGLTPVNPVGTSGAEPPESPRVGVPGAERLLQRAGEELVLADHRYRGLPAAFLAASDGASLPPSQWTSPRTGLLMPRTLLDDAAVIAADPRLAASVRLSIVAVASQPALLPIGRGYPVTPTKEFAVGISVENSGSAPTTVTAVIRAQPLGRLGHFDSGRARAVVAADGAVALQLPAMAVVPGEHCLVTIELERPVLQTRRTGLRWARVVVVGEEP